MVFQALVGKYTDLLIYFARFARSFNSFFLSRKLVSVLMVCYNFTTLVLPLSNCLSKALDILLSSLGNSFVPSPELGQNLPARESIQAG